jgi:hypothetical protein
MILKDPTDTAGYDLDEQAAAKLDYETNFKSQTVKADDLIVSETSFEIDKTWSQFKNLIDGVTYQWSDVRQLNMKKFYELHLITNEPL